jgi:hypothetical protein
MRHHVMVQLGTAFFHEILNYNGKKPVLKDFYARMIFTLSRHNIKNDPKEVSSIFKNKTLESVQQ